MVDRRTFVSWAAFAPLSAAAELFRGPSYQQALQEHPGATPLPTGLPALDEILEGGLPGTGVSLLLGRYTDCAEALLLNIVDHHLRTDDAPVAYVSVWHTRARIVDRLAYVRTGLDRFDRLVGRWTRREEETFEEARGQVARSPLHCEDARRLRPLAEVTAGLRRVQKAHGLGLVVVDDASWFTEGASQRDPVAAAHALGRGLRDLAVSSGIPLLAAYPILWDVPDEDSFASLQPALGPSSALLGYCAACMTVRQEDSIEGLYVQVEFHTAANRGDLSCHKYDRGSGRISDWA